MLLTRSPLHVRPEAVSSFDLHVLGTPPAFILSQDQTLRSGAPGGAPEAQIKISEKAIGMMVGTRDRVPLWNWSLVRRSPPAPCRRGPRTRSYPFPQYPVFKVPGGLSAPAGRFLPSAAQGDILRVPAFGVKNFFQKVLNLCGTRFLLPRIEIFDRRNPRSPRTRVS